MKQATRILVTGVGGDLGQSIVKAARLCTRPTICYGCDCIDTVVGRALVDDFQLVPNADASHYVDEINSLCRRLEVDAVVPASEAEIYTLSHLGDFPQ